MSEPPEAPPPGMSAVTADALRKGIAYGLAIVLTLLIFRVFGRLANGTQRFADLELYAMLLLGTLAIVWVRAAKRIRRPPPPPEA